MNGKKVGIGIGIVVLIAIVVGVIICFLPKDKEEIIYKVTFDNEGATEVVEVSENKPVPKPVNPVKEGYTFDGWYYNGSKFDFTTGITKDITIEARWIKDDAKKWEITFDTAGGKYIEKLTVVDGEKIGKLPTPVKEGYKFDGWYYDDEEFDSETTITEDITLVAKWKKNETKQETSNDTPKTTKYTVTFDSAGGSKVSSKSVEKNALVSKPSNPTRDGYTFVAWYNGSKEFDFKTKITGNITLTAKWKKNETPQEPAKPVSYTVTFDSAGGSSVPAQTIEKGKTVSNPSDPVRDNYDFIGWYYNGALYNFDTSITSNITLTAKWEKRAVISYKIEEIPESYVGQVKIFVLQDGVKVDGYVDITTTGGKTVTKEISKDGYITNGGKIESITNVRVK